ncbi:hypothetical protein B296_00010116 [Ensete ventricosum]|uniref:Uncharacterized protein n=1 Tax=Ensete ventricosum TaxID=4639 RepID=A0A427B8J5_ENSVE|nr:hypothetical protein B296_00010116 [Ensete ventricosum]
MHNNVAPRASPGIAQDDIALELVERDSLRLVERTSKPPEAWLLKDYVQPTPHERYKSLPLGRGQGSGFKHPKLSTLLNIDLVIGGVKSRRVPSFNFCTKTTSKEQRKLTVNHHGAIYQAEIRPDRVPAILRLARTTLHIRLEPSFANNF